MGCHFLLQGIFSTQGLNPCFLHLLHWQADSLPLPQLLGQIMDNKIQREQTKKNPTQLPLNKNRGLGAKIGYYARTLHTAPPNRWADHPSHRSDPLEAPLSSAHIRDQFAPPLGEQKNKRTVACSHPPTPPLLQRELQ